MLSNSRLFAALFWAALAFAVFMAIQPQPPALLVQTNDKIQHALAFAVLTALARFGFPRLHWALILGGLVFAGGAIELLQLNPALGREASWADFGADAASIAVVLFVTEPMRKALARTA